MSMVNHSILGRRRLRTFLTVSTSVEFYLFGLVSNVVNSALRFDSLLTSSVLVFMVAMKARAGSFYFWFSSTLSCAL